MADIEKTDVLIATGEVRLRGDLLSPSPGVPLVVLCHGIPLSKPDPSDPGYALLGMQLAEKGLAALFVNFRGCGESTGDFYLGGWYEDLCAVMDFAHEKCAFPRVYLMGFSAGGALAIKYAALNGGVDRVATFAAPARFTTVFPRSNLLMLIEAARDVGIIKDVNFPPSPDWFYADIEANDAMDYVARVRAPLLIVHGEEDELIPLSHGKELFQAAEEPKQFVALPKGEHRLRRDPRTIETFLSWLRAK
jgi:pimeloyl-ACP methyl ester carboxylesterase